MRNTISRRDFLSGTALVIAGGLTPFAQLRAEPGRYYPPVLTGLRGSHPGSFEVAHQVGRKRRGNVTIANCDAGWNSYTHEAIDQAWRAINELKGA
jgi:hypothetical protein